VPAEPVLGSGAGRVARSRAAGLGRVAVRSATHGQDDQHAAFAVRPTGRSGHPRGTAVPEEDANA
jgi:hypothetical protein